jgi:hypothetical protein
MDLEGLEPSPRTLTGSCAAITPQAHRPKLTLVTARLRTRRMHLSKENFVLEQTIGHQPDANGLESRGQPATKRTPHTYVYDSML